MTGLDGSTARVGDSCSHAALIGWRGHERPVESGPSRQRYVLTALAVDAGRVVPMERLTVRVWRADPPRRARATLHSYVSRLRQVLPAAETSIFREVTGRSIPTRLNGSRKFVSSPAWSRRT